MVLRARWEGIHQKMHIAGQVEILAADYHGGRGRDTAGPDFREHIMPVNRVSKTPRLPVLCVLSCVVRWSTQALHVYTGLILRQLVCNNL